MGGTGSGRWRWHATKRTVEDYAAVDIDGLIRAGLFDYKTGLIEWEWESLNPRNRAKYSFTYEVKQYDSASFKYLHLIRSNCRGEPEEQVIVLMSKPQPLGGVRWYFFCPSCHRPVRKLYLGTGKWFGCRICQELTYTSSQTHDRHTTRFQRDPELFQAGLKAHWSLKFKAFKFHVAKERRWWSKASALSLSITGIPQAEAAGNPRQ